METRDESRDGSPEDVFSAPWEWEPIPRREACLLWRWERIVAVVPRQGSGQRAIWFSLEGQLSRGDAPWQLRDARYYRRVAGLSVPVRRRQEDAHHVTSAQVAPPPAPARPAPPPPPPAPAPVTECELVSLDVKCSHGRKMHKGVLEVVAPPAGDKISLTAHMKGGCGKHPRWELPAGVRTGTSTVFAAEGWTVKSLLLFEVVPRHHHFNVTCCSGLTRQGEIRVYPCDKIEISIEAKKGFSLEVKTSPDEGHARGIKLDLTKKIGTAKDQADWVLEKVLKPWVEPLTFEVFKVKGRFAGGWEEAKDHRAFYKYKASIELDPLLKASIRIPFGPTAAIPPWIKKWATNLIGDFYLYLQFEGEIGLSGGWERTSPDVSSGTVGGKGRVGVKAGGSLFLMSKKAVNLDVCGATDISIEAKNVPHQQTPTIEWDLKWGGLKIELTIEAMWGAVEYKREWPVMKERSFFDAPKRWTPFK